MKTDVILPAVLKWDQSYQRTHGKRPSIDGLPFKQLFRGYPRHRTLSFSSSEINQFCIHVLIETVCWVRSMLVSRPETDRTGATLPNDLLRVCAMLDEFLVHCGVLDAIPPAHTP